jgi:RimJ/RimL family protein N-acetyltransferase
MVDCIRHIDKLISEGLHRAEWWAVVGNPACEIYDRLIERYGGSVAGYMHDCNYFNGKYYDSVMYEILFD